MGLLQLAAFGTWIAGLAIAVIAIVALMINLRDVAARLRALGFVYLGMSVVAGGGLLFLLAASANGRLPVIAGVPSFLLVGYIAVRLRIASSRAFVDSRKARTA